MTHLSSLKFKGNVKSVVEHSISETRYTDMPTNTTKLEFNQKGLLVKREYWHQSRMGSDNTTNIYCYDYNEKDQLNQTKTYFSDGEFENYLQCIEKYKYFKNGNFEIISFDNVYLEDVKRQRSVEEMFGITGMQENIPEGQDNFNPCKKTIKKYCPGVGILFIKQYDIFGQENALSLESNGSRGKLIKKQLFQYNTDKKLAKSITCEYDGAGKMESRSETDYENQGNKNQAKKAKKISEEKRLKKIRVVFEVDFRGNWTLKENYKSRVTRKITYYD